MSTTIKLEDETKELLDKENAEQETYDDTVKRLLGVSSGETWTREEITNLIDERLETHKRVETQLE